VAVQRTKKTINLCKPIYIGFSVLEMSKLLMYDFHYNEMKPRYGDNIQLCFTDTDSLLYDVKTDDIYKDMLERKELYDFSDYPTNHPNFSVENKKVLGKMKDEMSSRAILEGVFLKAKMYSTLEACGNEKSTAKGVKMSAQKKLTHQHYKGILFDGGRMRTTMNMMRNDRHEMNTITLNKVSLSAYDDKRYLHSDGVTSLAYGHCKIPTL
jgi:hypothetical protein